MKEKLVDRIGRLEQDGIIDPKSIDFTIKNPERVRRKFGHYLKYSQVVEAEVIFSEDIVRTVLPHMSTVLDRFLNIWVPQEKGHGEIDETYMDILGIDRLPSRQTVSKPMELAGRLARVSPGLHDAIEVLFLVYAGMGELEATKGYSVWSHDAREAGEVPLARTVFRMGVQEGHHLNFYKHAAHDRRAYLRPWQLELAAKFIERAYVPVGTHVSRKDAGRKEHFGHMIFTLSEERNLREFSDPVEKLARDLLNQTGDDLKPFVRRRYEECIEEYKNSLTS